MRCFNELDEYCNGNSALGAERYYIAVHQNTVHLTAIFKNKNLNNRIEFFTIFASS